MSERLPLPMPFGWFRVAESNELQKGEVKNIRVVGKDFVLYRDDDESGAAHVIDPFCPHLGAHLGHGGKVEGCKIRCPFHAWLYDAEGDCVEIPYAKKIPAKAKIKTYPVCEKNGIVFMWHHAKGEAPKWELPEVDEWCTDGWLEPITYTSRIKSHVQEIAENVVDSPHFHFVHGTPDIPEKTFTFDEHILRAKQELTFTTPQGNKKGYVDIESHAGLTVTRFSGVVDTLILITGTPIEDELHETIMRFSVKIIDGNIKATRGVAEAFIAEIQKQHKEDLPIWENKKYHENPVLCDGDGPIHTMRKYFKQFYLSE